MTDPSTSDRPAEPPDWPYPDLHLACPHCPICGWATTMMVAASVRPMAFCTNDDCRMFQFDPTKPAVEILLGASLLIEEQHPDGTVVWRGADRPVPDTEGP